MPDPDSFVPDIEPFDPDNPDHAALVDDQHDAHTDSGDDGGS